MLTGLHLLPFHPAAHPAHRAIPHAFRDVPGGAVTYMIHAKVEPKHDTIRARLLVLFLALAQPIARGWARYTTWLKFKRTPPAVIATEEKDFKREHGSISKLNYWTENG